MNKISQKQLQEFESLQMEMRGLQAQFDAVLGNMKDALRAGASVTTGERGVESGVRFRRYPSYKQAIIDKLGEDYQRKILDACESKPYFYVRFITKDGRGKR